MYFRGQETKTDLTCEPSRVRFASDVNMKQKMLECQIQAWNRKPALRMLYVKWFNEIMSHLVPGITLEIGCGIGRLKEYIPGLFSVDIVKTPWTDVVGDAQKLPFKAGNMSNLILFDVLHHLPRPLLFFFEALRILRNGGRVIIVEPYISTLSRFVYDRFHPESVCMNSNPLQIKLPLSSDRPFDSNQAVATLIFYRQLQAWQERFPEFSIIKRDRFAFFAYPATGGFNGKKLLPNKIICVLHMIEGLFAPFAGLLAFRTFVVLQKNI